MTPSSDVVERVARVLRKSREINCSWDDAERLAKAAIEASGYPATIERLSAERMQLREALLEIELLSTNHGGWFEQGAWKWGQMMGDVARAALSNTADTRA